MRWIIFGTLLGLGCLGWAGYASAQNVKATEVTRTTQTQTFVTYKFRAYVPDAAGSKAISLSFARSDAPTTPIPPCVNITTNALPPTDVQLTILDKSTPPTFVATRYEQPGCLGTPGPQSTNGASPDGASTVVVLFP